MYTTSQSKRITGAVDFLLDVHGKSYSDQILKKYLMEKRQLTSEEVDKAFFICKTRIKNEKKGSNQDKQPKKDLERPEKATTFSSRTNYPNISFLEVNLQPAGKKVIDQFLDKEKTYCQILSCLTREYYVHLIRYANEAQFKMSTMEIKAIFMRIPELLNFHSRFLMDLKRGSNIGRMFVKFFKFFEGYAEYMKDCQQTVNKFRKYIRDERLDTCVVKISEQSSRPNDDLVDLLLRPLDRIIEYRDFLHTLLCWTDRTQSSDYALLGKASRRIARVSAHIEKYKYGICNQNEMNKVQKFLRDQCDILTPERAIVRRGMMTRRSGWRKKHYVFFLFNDILLWTNRNGILQNALQLRSCEVMPSSAKNYAQRKFEVVYRGEKHKTLRLECVKVNERNDWYEAIKRTITAAKVKYNEAWTISESILSRKYDEYRDNFSDEENKASEGNYFSRENVEKRREEPSEQIEDPYNKRYTETSGFKIQEFKEIDPMGDNVSQISEQDVAFNQERRKKLPENSISSSSALSPFNDVSKKVDKATGNSSVVTQSPDKSGGHNRSGSVVLVRKKSPTKQIEEVKEEGFEFFDRRKKSHIVRKSYSQSTKEVKASPQFKFRLDNI